MKLNFLGAPLGSSASATCSAASGFSAITSVVVSVDPSPVRMRQHHELSGQSLEAARVARRKSCGSGLLHRPAATSGIPTQVEDMLDDAACRIALLRLSAFYRSDRELASALISDSDAFPCDEPHAPVSCRSQPIRNEPGHPLVGSHRTGQCRAP